MAHWYLYAIRLPTNDYTVAYVGVTKVFRKRVKAHCGSKYPIGGAIRLCGRENVVSQKLVCGSKDFIYDLEAEAIAAFNTRWPNGYNLASGGFGGRDPLPSSRLKTSLALRGRAQSAEHCANKAATRIGTTRSIESRQKQSASKRGKSWSPAKWASYDPAKQLAAQKKATIAAAAQGVSAKRRAAMILRSASRERNQNGQWISHGY